MKITILPQGTLAIYEQIVNQLKNAVVTGERSEEHTSNSSHLIVTL